MKKVRQLNYGRRTEVSVPNGTKKQSSPACVKGLANVHVYTATRVHSNPCPQQPVLTPICVH